MELGKSGLNGCLDDVWMDVWMISADISNISGRYLGDAASDLRFSWSVLWADGRDQECRSPKPPQNCVPWSLSQNGGFLSHGGYPVAWKNKVYLATSLRRAFSAMTIKNQHNIFIVGRQDDGPKFTWNNLPSVSLIVCFLCFSGRKVPSKQVLPTINLSRVHVLPGSFRDYSMRQRFFQEA